MDSGDDCNGQGHSRGRGGWDQWQKIRSGFYGVSVQFCAVADGGEESGGHEWSASLDL